MTARGSRRGGAGGADAARASPPAAAAAAAAVAAACRRIACAMPRRLRKEKERPALLPSGCSSGGGVASSGGAGSSTGKASRAEEKASRAPLARKPRMMALAVGGGRLDALMATGAPAAEEHLARPGRAVDPPPLADGLSARDLHAVLAAIEDTRVGQQPLRLHNLRAALASAGPFEAGVEVGPGQLSDFPLYTSEPAHQLTLVLYTVPCLFNNK